MALGNAARTSAEKGMKPAGDERRSGRALAHEDLFPVVARRYARADRQRIDFLSPRALQSVRVRLVRDDDRDLGPEPSVRDRVDERLQVAPPPGNEDRYPPILQWII